MKDVTMSISYIKCDYFKIDYSITKFPSIKVEVT